MEVALLFPDLGLNLHYKQCMHAETLHTPSTAQILVFVQKQQDYMHFTHTADHAYGLLDCVKSCIEVKNKMRGGLCCPLFFEIVRLMVTIFAFHTTVSNNPAEHVLTVGLNFSDSVLHLLENFLEKN